MAGYRSSAINVWSQDKSSTQFKVNPDVSKTNIYNNGKPIDIYADVRIYDSSDNLVNPIEYADELVKDSSGITVNFDYVQTLLSDSIDSSGNLVSNHAQIQTNKTDIATNSTSIADHLARIIVLEAQMQQLTNP